MGFARVTSDASVSASFNSSGGIVSARRIGTGQYEVGFRDLGAIGGHAAQGNVQVVAEGTNNLRCQFRGTAIGISQFVYVDCHAPDASFANAAFSVLFYRAPMPAPSSRPANHAYTFVEANGSIPSNGWDYNSSGVHNTIVKTGIGRYEVHITNGTAINASVMVTPADAAQPGNVCSVVSWSAGRVRVECRSPAGVLEDTRFSFSFATSGPTIDQQGAHAWFDGSRAHPTYSAANGKYSYCSPASIVASRVGSLTTVTVSGDLGSWDGTPFLHVPFASPYGSAGYCKIESSTSAGAAPAWTGTSMVRCYAPNGSMIAAPRFTFTDITSEAAGPC